MILFFDTETTGLPKNYQASPADLDNWPRIIQFAWACYNFDGALLESHSYLIRPFGWEIPKLPFWIDNGFSTQKSLAEGHDIEKVLTMFALDVEVASLLVAHNSDFDTPIVTAEMIRANVSVRNKPTKFCTMKASTNICCIPSMRGYKWPKLEELHRFLFGCDFEGAHDASSDVMATAKCYFELVRRGLIPADGKMPEKPKPAPKLNININNL